MTKPAFIFILGMHRSGTSCLAGSLERCGLHLGDVSRYNKFNVRGNHELPRVVDLHNRILQANGGSWLDPPLNIKIGPELEAEMRQVLRAFSAPSPGGMKDPRQLLMVEAWMQLAAGSRLVGTYRHPEAVAQSLARRNKAISADQANALWVRYNTELARLHRQNPFALLEFDLTNPDRYINQVAGIALEFGLNPDFPALRRFISASLDHSPGEGGPIPETCRALYDYLREHSYELTADRLQRIHRSREALAPATGGSTIRRISWRAFAKAQAVRLLPRPILRRARLLLRRGRALLRRQDGAG